MFSRVFVRTVLVVIAVVMGWFIDLVWSSASFENIAQRVAPTVVCGGVLVAALSLLNESLRSFGTITVKRSGLWYVLSGFYDGESCSVRTCELFWLRSVFLTITSLMMVMVVFSLFLAIVYVINFLSNPHIPTVSWEGFVSIMVMSVSVFLGGGLIMCGNWLLDKKMADKKMFARVLVIGLYWCVAVGIFLGFLLHFLGKGLSVLTLHEDVLMGIGVTLALASAGGMIFGIGLGLYKLVGKASTRFPVLGNVWNTICPVQTINFIE
ncbi:MAG TPA: hypothetical protein VJC06_01670 [Candidatus Paceibacterota bacterium]